MEGIDKVQLILSAIIEILLIISIVIAIMSGRVSVLSFVIVALVAMIEVCENFFVGDGQNRRR